MRSARESPAAAAAATRMPSSSTRTLRKGSCCVAKLAQSSSTESRGVKSEQAPGVPPQGGHGADATREVVWWDPPE